MYIEIYKGCKIKENTISGKTKGESYYTYSPILKKIIYGTTVEILKRKIDRITKG